MTPAFFSKACRWITAAALTRGRAGALKRSPHLPGSLSQWLAGLGQGAALPRGADKAGFCLQPCHGLSSPSVQGLAGEPRAPECSQVRDQGCTPAGWPRVRGPHSGKGRLVWTLYVSGPRPAPPSHQVGPAHFLGSEWPPRGLGVVVGWSGLCRHTCPVTLSVPWPFPANHGPLGEGRWGRAHRCAPPPRQNRSWTHIC